MAREAPLLCFFFLLFSNKIGKENAVHGTLCSFRCEGQQDSTYLWLYFSEGITDRRELEVIKCHFLQRPGQKQRKSLDFTGSLITQVQWGKDRSLNSCSTHHGFPKSAQMEIRKNEDIICAHAPWCGSRRWQSLYIREGRFHSGGRCRHRWQLHRVLH